MPNLASRLLLTTLLIAPGALSAQDTPFDLGEIILEGGLLPTTALTTGATINTVEPGTLEASGPRAAEVLDRLPGITVSRNGGIGATATVRIRGLGSNYIGVSVDGIDVNDPSSTQNRFDFGTLTTAGIGQMTVIKGTQSAVYGSDAIAGAIAIESWRPERDGISGQASVDVGSYDTRGATFSSGYRDATTEFGFSISRTESEGFSAQDTNTEADGFQQTAINLFGAYQVTDSLRLGFTALSSDSTTEFDAFQRQDAELDEDKSGARVFAEFTTGAWTHELSAQSYDVTRFDAGGFTQLFEGKRKNLGYLAQGDVSPQISLAFGADWTKEESSSDGVRAEATNRAVFGEMQYRPTDAVELSFILRYDDYSDFDSVLSGRAAMAYQASDATTIRASVGTGYRAPSLYERFGPYAAAALRPEESVSVDLGIEHRYGDWGVIAATLFQSEIEDLIGFQSVPSCLAVPVQAFGCYTQIQGKTRTKGLELSGAFSLTDALSLSGSYTYTDSTTNGTRLINVPRHDLTLALDAQVSDRFSLGARVTHVADTLDGFGTLTPLDDYTLLDLSVRVQMSERASLVAALENVGDRDYQTVRGFNTPGRTFRLGISADF